MEGRTRWMWVEGEREREWGEEVSVEERRKMGWWTERRRGEKKLR